MRSPALFTLLLLGCPAAPHPGVVGTTDVLPTTSASFGTTDREGSGASTAPSTGSEAPPPSTGALETSTSTSTSTSSSASSTSTSTSEGSSSSGGTQATSSGSSGGTSAGMGRMGTTGTSGGGVSSGDTACVPDCGGIACGTDAQGCFCGECSALATCAVTYCARPLGNFTHLGNRGNIAGSSIIGHRVSVPFNTRLRGFGVILSDPGNEGGDEVQMALYTNDPVGPGGPHQRLRQTGPLQLVDGVNEAPVDGPELAAGDYWVMIHAELGTFVARTPITDHDYELAFAEAPYPANGESFPPTMTSEEIVFSYRYNVYIVVEE